MLFVNFTVSFVANDILANSGNDFWSIFTCNIDRKTYFVSFVKPECHLQQMTLWTLLVKPLWTENLAAKSDKSDNKKILSMFLIMKCFCKFCNSRLYILLRKLLEHAFEGHPYTLLLFYFTNVCSSIAYFLFVIFRKVSQDVQAGDTAFFISCNFSLKSLKT